MNSEATSTLPTAASPGKSACPWGNVATSPLPCSLSAVMDEQLARDLQKEDETSEGLPPVVEESKAAGFASEFDNHEDAGKSDLLLAQMLQLQFDEEHDQYLRAKEKQCNGTSKVSMSFEKYKAVHPYVADESWGNEEEDSYDEDSDYEEDDDSTKPTSTKNSNRTKKGSEIVTKHDANVCGKRNAQHVAKFPPTFAAGNVTSKDLNVRLPNSVYNSLKQHSIKEEKYAYKIHDKKERATHEHALDSNTRLILYKMVDNQTLESINGCVSTGKEAVVFHADGGSFEDKIFPKECAVKVFKTTLNEFKTRDKYIKDDFRFQDRFSKQNPRKVVRLWAEKEMRNLKRIYAAGINCPEPLLLRKHILIMEFIGEDQKAAPKLKDANLPLSRLQEAYMKCVEMMHTLYNECHLVHADLSEYNLLWHRDRVWLIDVSQSVEPTHPKALDFLVRDCTNITAFFKRAGLPDMYTVEELFNHVSGLDIKGEEEEFLEAVRDFEKNEELLTYGVSDKPYPFDYFFKKSESSQETEKSG